MVKYLGPNPRIVIDTSSSSGTIPLAALVSSARSARMDLLEIIADSEVEITEVRVAHVASKTGETEVSFRYAIVPKAMVPTPGAEEVRARAREIIAKFTTPR